MTRAVSNRLTRLETVVAEQFQQQQAARKRNAHSKAANATPAEITDIFSRYNAAPDRQSFITAADDHELIVLFRHWEKYNTSTAAVTPERVSTLIRAYDLAPDTDVFFEELTDDELDALIDDNDGVDWDGVPLLALEAFEDGEITYNELRERYPKKQEGTAP